MNMNKSLFIIIVLWIVISVGRTFYNFSKLFTEEREWYNLSDQQKKVKLFGDLDPFFRFVEKNTSPKDSILFLAPGGKAYFLSRYYLYPRRIFYIKDQKEIELTLKKQSYDFLLEYQTNDPNLDENNSYTWRVSQNTKFVSYMSHNVYNSAAALYKL